jgi:hypothetical protein
MVLRASSGLDYETPLGSPLTASAIDAQIALP